MERVSGSMLAYYPPPDTSPYARLRPLRGRCRKRKGANGFRTKLRSSGFVRDLSFGSLFEERLLSISDGSSTGTDGTAGAGINSSPVFPQFPQRACVCACVCARHGRTGRTLMLCLFRSRPATPFRIDCRSLGMPRIDMSNHARIDKGNHRSIPDPRGIDPRIDRAARCTEDAEKTAI